MVEEIQIIKYLVGKWPKNVKKLNKNVRDFFFLQKFNKFRMGKIN